MRLLAAPAAAQHLSVATGLESHASFAALAARQTDAALERCAHAVATELVVAVRALRMREHPPDGGGVRAAFERAAAVLPADPADRPLSGDLRLARGLVLSGPLTGAARR